MTIAAGFLTTGGVLLCADTMYSGGNKVLKPKLFPVLFAKTDLLVAYALSGSDAYGRMAIQIASRAIEAIPSETRTLSSVEEAIAASVKRIHEDYVDTRPIEERDSARFDLIVAIRHRHQGVHMYTSFKAAFSETWEDYACVGAAEYLAGYLLRGHDRRTSLRKTILASLGMLRSVKSYDADCGGHSQLLFINQEALIPEVVQQYEVEVAEESLTELDAIIKEIPYWVSNDKLSDQEFEHRIGALNSYIREVRSKWRERLEDRAKTVKIIRKLEDWAIEQLN